MDGRPQVRQCNPIDLRQRNLDRRTDRQRFQILEDSLDQVMVLPAPIPPQVGEDHAVIVQCGFLILYVFFSHTFVIPRSSLRHTYMILRYACQLFFYYTLDTFIVYARPVSDILQTSDAILWFFNSHLWFFNSRVDNLLFFNSCA